MMGVLSEEAGVISFTTYKNTENANSTVMLSEIFSSESGGIQYTWNDCQKRRLTVWSAVGSRCQRGFFKK